LNFYIDEVLDLRFQADSTYEKYRKSVEKSNELVTKNSEKYQSLADSFLKAEELKINIIQNSLQKYSKITEILLKSYVEFSQNISKLAENIDQKNDLQKIFEENKKFKELQIFNYLKCEKYDFEYFYAKI